MTSDLSEIIAAQLTHEREGILTVKEVTRNTVLLGAVPTRRRR